MENNAKEMAKNAMVQNRENNAMVKSTSEAKRVKSLLEQFKPSLQKALQKKIDVEYLASCTMSIFRANPELYECTNESIVHSLFLSAQMGLRLDGPLGHAFLIPRNITNKKTGQKQKEAQFQIGYKGYMELVRRSGEILSITPGIVKEMDEFDYEFGTNERILFRPSSGERGKVTHYFAYARLTSGGCPFKVMSINDMNEFVDKYIKIKSGKFAGQLPFGVWRTDFDAMALKTVIGQLANFLPQSVDFAKAAELDKMSSLGLPQNIQIQNGQLESTGFQNEEVHYAEPVD